YHPREGKSPEQENKCLTTAVDAEVLRDLALSRIRNAAETGELGLHARLAYLLYRWRDFVGDGGAEVRRWSNQQLDRGEMIVLFAKHSRPTDGVTVRPTRWLNGQRSRMSGAWKISSTKGASACASRNWLARRAWVRMKSQSSKSSW